ncbi:carbonic anhydrase [Tepidiphilus margaritifer]|uniref:carbonic anhydrase n=1 Tax=Tepidiphilus margaritifer TaxID=203471 RepID=UPI0003F4FF58|nr:carbonic anhydrase family protein [Tepidiphilus margaritifer]
MALGASRMKRWMWGIVCLAAALPLQAQETAADVSGGEHKTEAPATPEGEKSSSPVATKPAAVPGAAQSKRSARSSAAWGYGPNNGPSQWAKLSREYFWCGIGKNQSPIDIRREDVLTTDLRAIDFAYGPVTVRPRRDNGVLTLQVVSGKASITDEQHRFVLTSIQFHSPSEHTDGGNRYPLEAQLLHQDKEGNVAVVAIWFRRGEANPVLDEILSAAQKKGGASVSLDPGKLLPPTTDFYRYNGSLTTPPCTEGVRWYVMSETAEASEEQLRAFLSLTGRNNRPVQPLNARRVFE